MQLRYNPGFTKKNNKVSVQYQEYINTHGIFPRCFFTGVYLTSVDTDDKMRASIEHLVPPPKDRKDRYKRKLYDAPWNLVWACAHANSLLGNAPLVVKYAFKRFCEENAEFEPKMDNKKLAGHIGRLYSKFIVQYQVKCGNKRGTDFPWRWKCYTKPEQHPIRARLYVRYAQMLTTEEKQLVML